MEKIKFSMNASNLKSIPLEKYEKDFTFIVNGERIQTCRFLADFYSPIIRKYHFEDETQNEFIINTSFQIDKNREIFENFLTLYSKDEVEINDQERTIYIEFFLKLGNYEEYSKLIQIDFENLDPENVIDRLKRVTNLEVIENDNIKKIIKYASEHFYEISIEKLKTVEKSLIEEIIENENLKLEDEDSLLLFVLELYEENNEYSDLFEYVKFNELSEEALYKFIENFDIEYLNQNTFRSICEGIANKNNHKQERYFVEFLEFSYKRGEELRGIMRYLSDQTGGNIHDNGTIEITSNSISKPIYFKWKNLPSNLVDYQNIDDEYGFDGFQFDDVKNSEICFDFKDKKIKLTKYSIKSMNLGVDCRNLRNWVLEVSNDKKSWLMIDMHDNDNTLNCPKITAIFNTKETNKFYRYVRLCQTGMDWSGFYDSKIYRIEFYGKLKISGCKMKSNS